MSVNVKKYRDRIGEIRELIGDKGGEIVMRIFGLTVSVDDLEELLFAYEASTIIARELKLLKAQLESTQARELSFARVILAQQIDVTGETKALAEQVVKDAKVRARR